MFLSLGLIVLLLPAHERLFEGWQHLEAHGNLLREQTKDLLLVQHGRRELTHVLTDFRAVLLIDLVLQVLWQPDGSDLGLELRLQILLLLFLEHECLRLHVHGTLLRMLRKVVLLVLRHGLALQTASVLMLLEELDEQLVALRQEERSDLFATLVR